jgi:peptidyl-Lys metalloendopeptidase
MATQSLSLSLSLENQSKCNTTVSQINSLQPSQLIMNEPVSDAYDFTAAGAGSYTLEARKRFHHLDTTTNKSIVIDADTDHKLVHRAIITGDLAVTRRSLRKRNSRIMRRANFNGCSAEQQSQILEGATAAKKYASDTYSYVQSNSKTDRLKTWYGEFEQDRFNRLVQTFKNMNDNDFSSFDYDCSCDEADLFAYVYPEDWGTVHLCGAFWAAPVTGTNSKVGLASQLPHLFTYPLQGGTIFHEATHFKENAGTEDNAYGQGKKTLCALR